VQATPDNGCGGLLKTTQLAKEKGKYAGRKTDIAVHELIIALRRSGRSIAETAKLARCSESQVKRVWALHRGSALANTETSK
jgi:DNA invertase Pin-like site-specific DNA recombinase